MWVNAEPMKMDSSRVREDIILRGRMAIVFRLSSNYLFLPFAALCVSASLVHFETSLWIVCAPFAGQVLVAMAASRMKKEYDRRDPADDPKPWARKFLFYSALSGSVWGIGAVVWFVPESFPAQAYLVLAFLGMTATEFVARGAYRPAYFVHAAASLFPLAAILALQGNVYTQATALIMLFFEGVLYTYSGVLERHLDESILLRHDNARLIARLLDEKRSAELARDCAQESERSKSAFISSISHEIRTPLNAALGMAQLLEQSNLQRSQRDHVRVILEAGRGLKILLDDIIALSQIGDKPLSSTPGDGCDAGQAARTVGRLLQPNAWEKRLRLSVNVAPGLPRAAADPRLLRRILLKLAGNAIKFTERGKIDIAVDAMEDPNGAVTLRFRVSDTGPGIPRHLVDKIFDPLAKADESYARRYNGAGLGLAVVQRLVQGMNGTVGVESKTAVGTTFWVAVPAVQASSRSSDDVGDAAAAPNGLSVLAYLPDRNMRTSLEHMLSPSGNRITFGTSLSDTTRLAARGDFALLICDAGSADTLIAAPRAHTPVLALARKEDRVPENAESVLRWPTSASALYSAIAFVTVNGEAEIRDASDESESEDTLIDTASFADLEKSLGLKTLIDILQSYMATAEQLTEALSAALDAEEWAETARVAQDIGGAAGGLGLTALTDAARQLAQNARDGADQEALASTAQAVLTQHEKTRDALRRLYPDLAA
jgi:signal transduction histidine kinase/HPt (histidine-containing phosphotransfer) domain-containing protein